MSVNGDYQIYSGSGGALSEAEYDIHLNNLKETIGFFIDQDPTNTTSDIGKRIFKHLNDDVTSTIALSRTSKGLNTRSKDLWFLTKSRDIVLKYVQIGTSYSDYIKDGGWKDFVLVGAKATCVALTIAGSVKASIHASNIPLDAPRKTTTYIDDYGEIHEITYIDHPEARTSEMWAGIATCAGIGVAAGIAHSMYNLLKDVDLNSFFSATDKEIVESEQPNLAVRIVSPGFHNWKMTKMKEKLTSNPPNWQQHPELSKMICPISGNPILFPVKDKCGHYFDYRSVRGYQLNPETAAPLRCPVSKKTKNIGLSRIQFDKAKFDYIQQVLSKSNNEG